MSEYTGRGPTKARTYVNEDLVSVLLRDTLTKGERSLVSSDNHIEADVAVEIFVLEPASRDDERRH